MRMTTVVWRAPDVLPSPFYDFTGYELRSTDRDVSNYKLFEKGDLVVGRDGFVRKLIARGWFSKKSAPADMVRRVTIDGMRMCSFSKNILPEKEFVNELGGFYDTCPKMREYKTRSSRKKGTLTARRYAFYEEQKRKDILEFGCCVEGCPMNDILQRLVDGDMLATFEYDHLDQKNKCHLLSDMEWFTDDRAKRLGFKEWKELWFHEQAKCRMICNAHHRQHSGQQSASRAKRSYDQITK